jgi:hypothetical protein
MEVLSIFENNVPFFDVTVKEGIIFLIAICVIAFAIRFAFGGGWRR